MAYRLGGDVEHGFRQASLLQAAGCSDAFVRVCLGILNGSGASHDVSFRAGRELWRAGRSVVEDPLFECGVDETSFDIPCARFSVQFVAAGLWISVALDLGDALLDKSVSDCAYILLDGVMLRKQRVHWVGSHAEFQFVVKRRTLEHFPARGRLRLALGDTASSAITVASTVIIVPHGDSSIADKIASLGPLEKKGELRPSAEALRQKQQAYLDIYTRANAAFEAEYGHRLFLLYGTLLGQCREGDFIPGDDDFDVGYVSEQTEPVAVRHEAMAIMRFFVEKGFKVLVNRFGKPFRLTDPNAGPGVHLDVRPVWSPGDGHVWLHKSAHLKMSLDAFRNLKESCLRSVRVDCPLGAEQFLCAYYGPNWRVPDPTFTNSGKTLSTEVRAGLAACCLTWKDQLQLMQWTKSMGVKKELDGEFVAIALESLYPLAIYMRRAGE